MKKLMLVSVQLVLAATCWAKFDQPILDDTSPASATVLDHKPSMELLRKYPDLYGQVVEQKNLIRYVDEMLKSQRTVLGQRQIFFRLAEHAELVQKSELGPQPEKLAAWAAKNGYPKATVDGLLEAGWHWGEGAWPGPDLKKVLAEKNVDAARWNAAPFSQRFAAMKLYAAAQANMLMATPGPWTREQASAFYEQIRSMAGLLDAETASSVTTHYRKVFALSKALHYSNNASPDTRTKGALERAADPKLGLDGQLAVMDSLFFSRNPPRVEADVVRDVLEWTRPQKDVSVTDAQRESLENVLPNVLLKVSRTVPTGRQVTKMYDTIPLKVRVSTTGSSSIAYYDHSADMMTIGEERVRAWLKQRHMLPKDLYSPENLERFALELSPIFIHEATHQQQDEKLPDYCGVHRSCQENEMAALTTQTKYAMELARTYPWFWSQSLADRGKSEIADWTVDLLAHGKAGPDALTSLMRGTYGHLDTVSSLASRYQAEINQLRAKLEALEGVSFLKGVYDRAVKLLARKQRELDKWYETMRASSKHTEQCMDSICTELKQW